MKKIIALFLVLLLTLAVGCNEKKPTPGKKDTTTSSSTVTDSSDENSSSEDTVSDVYKRQVLPLIVLYAFTQRFFVQSVERSGLVG